MPHVVNCYLSVFFDSLGFLPSGGLSSVGAVKRRPATIKDVAKRAGVGLSTVSRVVREAERVDPNTRSRVQAAIKELGYRPNFLARGLVTRRTRSLALITPPPAPYTHPIVENVASECKSRGYATLLCPASTWEHEDLSFRWVHENWRVDGVLIYSILHHRELPPEIRDLQSAGVPVVFINKFLNDGRVQAVGVDTGQAVQQAVDHLAALGHRRIAILNGHRNSEDGAMRFAAFRAAMDKAGLVFDERLARDAVFEESLAREHTRGLLGPADRPTAIFCANDHMAIGAMRAASDAGLRVPDDVSIIGFDDIELARYVSPALTTVRPPLAEVGRQAVELMLEVLREPSRAPEQRRLRAELIVRGTTAPCR
jgi:DNA-binding LacI/PurR family transcriptional regulator